MFYIFVSATAMKPEAVKRNKMKRDIIKKIEELEAGIRYCIAQIASTTENWIKKEYMGVIASHEAEISELKHRLQYLSQQFNYMSDSN